MTEAHAAASSGAGSSAGGLLRAAREKQGLHIAALAAAIKVVPRKLELLEADRFDELPDATFTRALAQTVCRALKIDPVPVLEKLPPPAGHRLEHVSGGLNTPFRERPGALALPEQGELFASPAFWIVSSILLAALAIYFVPGRFVGLGGKPADIAAPETPAASAGDITAQPAVGGAAAGSTPSVGLVADAAQPASSNPAAETTASSLAGTAGGAAAPVSLADGPAETAAPGSAPAAASAARTLLPEAAGLLRMRPSTPSWIGVVDARGKSLVSRLVAAGESIGIDGQPPFKVTIGNAAGTEVVFRDQPVELPAVMRDGVARLVLK